MVGPSSDADQQRKLEAGRRMLDKFRKDKGTARPSPFVKPRAAQQRMAVTTGAVGGESSSTAAGAGSGVHEENYSGSAAEVMLPLQSSVDAPTAACVPSNFELREGEEQNKQMPTNLDKEEKEEENAVAAHPEGKKADETAADEDPVAQPEDSDGASHAGVSAVPLHGHLPDVQEDQGMTMPEQEKAAEGAVVAGDAAPDPIPEPLNRVDAPAGEQSRHRATLGFARDRS